MKLRTNILLLCFLAVISAVIGGYLYYTSIKDAVIEDVKQEGSWHLELISNSIDSHFSSNLKAVKIASGLKELKLFLMEPDQIPVEDVNQVIDDFRSSFEADVSYLMDSDGVTRLSSNRNDPASFIGENYSFRPYFKAAMQGKSFVYPALGFTSNKRGIYYSHPVYVRNQNRPSGVFVMKFSLDQLENQILDKHFDISGMIAFIIDPDGVIFMSNKKEYLFHLLKKVTEHKMKAMLEEKQFGTLPLRWSGFTESKNNVWGHASGREYIAVQKDIIFLPGWKIVHLHDIASINQLVRKSFSDRFSWIALSLCIVLGISAVILYQRAHQNIVQREKAEKSLVESKSFLNSLLSAIPLPVFYKDIEGRYQGFNKAFERFFGKKEKELVGKSVFDISPKELAQIYHAKDSELFESGGTQHYESKVKNAKNEMRDVIFDKSVYTDNNGTVVGLIGTVLDITERQQVEKEREKLIDELQAALKEIKTLRGIVPICSNCKKIRDDEGYWNILESYIQKHSDASFSHSMCPECSEKLYGNEAWYIKMKKQGKIK